MAGTGVLAALLLQLHDEFYPIAQRYVVQGKFQQENPRGTGPHPLQENPEALLSSWVRPSAQQIVVLLEELVVKVVLERRIKRILQQAGSVDSNRKLSMQR